MATSDLSGMTMTAWEVLSGRMVLEGGEIGLGTGGVLFGGGEGSVENGLVTKNKDDDEDEEEDDEEDEAEDELDEGEDVLLTAVDVATNKT